MASRSDHRPCKDCSAEWGGFPSPSVVRRPAPYPGPRCHTHYLAERDRVKQASHARRVAKTYGLKDGQYEELYAAQGGVCALCQRATGKTKKLAVDHDHKTGYVRGLLCSPCNKLLGHLRDDVMMAIRIAKYLRCPPAFDVIGEVKSDES